MYSTELWEIIHQPLRRQKLGNLRNPDFDALTKHAKQSVLAWDDNELNKKERKKHDNFDVVGNVEQRELNAAEITGLKSCYKLVWKILPAIPLPKPILWADKAYVGGHVLVSGSFLEISHKSNQQCWYAEFSGIFSHTFNNTTYKWLYVVLFKKWQYDEINSLTTIDKSIQSQDFVPVSSDYSINKVHAIIETTKIIVNHWAKPAISSET